MLKQRFVIDTSALTDSTVHEREGYSTLDEGVTGILETIASARLHLGISCMIPYPTVYKEFTEYCRNNGCNEDIIIMIDTWLVKRTPDRYEVKLPAKIFYDYVKFMRSRINKSMIVAEESIWQASKQCLTIDLRDIEPKDIEMEVERNVMGNIINKFRNKYRNTLRYGILDSAPDIDVLLLAKELDAAVVSADHGIQKWAEHLGVRYVDAVSFPRMLKEYLRHVHPTEISLDTEDIKQETFI